jgi:hypothetical protein
MAAAPAAAALPRQEPVATAEAPLVHTWETETMRHFFRPLVAFVQLQFREPTPGEDLECHACTSRRELLVVPDLLAYGTGCDHGPHCN